MTNYIRINEKNHTIEITKKFAAAAKRFGTAEYEDLQTVRRDYPRYRVEIKTPTRKSDCFKGLTYEYMESYIRNHDDKETLVNFFLLCGKDENGENQEFAASATYGEIKKWFLDAHEELRIQRKTIDEILGKNKVA